MIAAEGNVGRGMAVAAVTSLALLSPTDASARGGFGSGGFREVAGAISFSVASIDMKQTLVFLHPRADPQNGMVRRTSS